MGNINFDKLQDYAFIYTVSRGGSSGIKFMLSTEDARKWCSSDKSKGGWGMRAWISMYTSAYNFLFVAWTACTADKLQLDLSKCKDDGREDKDLKELGLTKYDFVAIKKILADYGFNVKLPRETKESSKIVVRELHQQKRGEFNFFPDEQPPIQNCYTKGK